MTIVSLLIIFDNFKFDLFNKNYFKKSRFFILKLKKYYIEILYRSPNDIIQSDHLDHT